MARLPKPSAKERRQARRAERVKATVRVVCDNCGLEQAAQEKVNCQWCHHDTGSTHEKYNDQNPKVNPMGDHFG